MGGSSPLFLPFLSVRISPLKVSNAQSLIMSSSMLIYPNSFFPIYAYVGIGAADANHLEHRPFSIPTKDLPSVYPSMVSANAFISGAPPPVCHVVPIPNFRLGGKTSFWTHPINIPHISNGIAITRRMQFSFNTTHHSTPEIGPPALLLILIR